MKYKDFFGSAKTLSFPGAGDSVLLRRSFTLDKIPASAEINIVGFGFFTLFINGKSVTDDLFTPLNSEYHPRKIIIGDEDLGEVFGTRTYVCRYSVGDFLTEGENVIAVMLGNGWYADRQRAKFGEKKAVFSLCLEGENGKTFISSDESALFAPGFIKESVLTTGEKQDYRGYPDGWMLPGFSCVGFNKCAVCEFPETDFYYADCPADRVIRTVSPVIIKSEIGKTTYDIGVNTTGRVVIRLTGDEGDKVTVLHSEEKDDRNSVTNDTCSWGQISEFISDGKERTVKTEFTWNGFRYFSVEGNARVECVEIIHTDCAADSSFKAENSVITWLYDAFINTQLSNMHAGIPSDCPHLERRGYTGDGELACDAAMTSLDSEGFYRKWMRDISDCQDRLSGHVQYTAPYVQSGGGPGGWGCAIVHVPYMFYRRFGDLGPMKEYYPQMLEYFRYLDDHSENGLVISDKPGEWCLGDWCTARDIAIPCPFVNNYFYVRSIDEILELSDKLALAGSDIDRLKAKREYLAGIICEYYYDASTGDFCGGVQGANAFAVDIGLGDTRTYANLVSFYEKEGMFDTGIFGTDILIRVLFKNGDAPLAYTLLSSEKMFSFGAIKNAGATSLWEYWYGRRSHSHPMFGAVVVYLFRFLLGIDKTAGDTVSVAPLYPGKDEHFTGFVTLGAGRLCVDAEYKDSAAYFKVISPLPGVLTYAGKTLDIRPGENTYSL